MVGYNFTENFTVDVAMGILEKPKTISQAISLVEFIDQLLLKIISLQEESTDRLIFWINKVSKLLLDTFQSKKREQQLSGAPTI